MLIGSSLLRSRLIKEEFPWNALCFSAKLTPIGDWAEWVNHMFASNQPFVVVLQKAQHHQSATVGLAQSHSRIRSGDIRSDADVVVQAPSRDPLVLAQAPSRGRRSFLLRSSPSVLAPPLPVKSRPSGSRSSSGQVLSGSM
ncbi:polyprotein [Sesbania bispinosa]|nr:polyprotein [Sesbania bispinosa]